MTRSKKMIVMIPVEGINPETNINIAFGRTPYFLIHDTKTRTSRYIENTAASSQGGAGIKAAQLIVDNGADVVITPACGKNSADVLTASGIKIYKSSGSSATSNIEALLEGKLSILTDIHPGFHGHGGSGN